MKSGDTIIFFNPDLLQSEYGFELLRDYLASNTIEDFSRISDIVDGELVIEAPNFQLGESKSISDHFWVSQGYWKVNLESLKEIVGIK